MDLNIEITTVCNSKCRFCTHETLIKDGTKQSRHMDFSKVSQAIDRLKDITIGRGIRDEMIRFSPVGLGEPLLHPEFFDIIEYSRGSFPSAHLHANTNCISLREKNIVGLIKSDLDEIRLSLCFNDADTYKEWCGVDKYDRVVENIRNFLRTKKNRKPNATIHIFTRFLNRREFSRFAGMWTPYLNDNDSLLIQTFLPVTEWEKKVSTLYPCNQLWSVMMVDIDGFVFPCCLGVWTKKDENLCLGHITEDPLDLLRKINEIRRRHIDGDYRICESCAYRAEEKRNCRKFYTKIRRLQWEYMREEHRKSIRML